MKFENFLLYCLEFLKAPKAYLICQIIIRINKWVFWLMATLRKAHLCGFFVYSIKQTHVLSAQYHIRLFICFAYRL